MQLDDPALVFRETRQRRARRSSSSARMALPLGEVWSAASRHSSREDDSSISASSERSRPSSRALAWNRRAAAASAFARIARARPSTRLPSRPGTSRGPRGRAGSLPARRPKHPAWCGGAGSTGAGREAAGNRGMPRATGGPPGRCGPLPRSDCSPTTALRPTIERGMIPSPPDGTSVPCFPRRLHRRTSSSSGRADEHRHSIYFKAARKEKE